MTNTALDRQVGGGHYKDLKIQPIEYCHANNIPFTEGCIIKYATRWRDKGGIDDLRKIIHFAELLIELELSDDDLKATPPPPWLSVEQFEKSGYQGRCWLLYKTRPVICIYTGELYTFGSSNGVYMTECISGVIPLPTPSTEL